jgi:CubicO group peptidase (beta-lactamase class C family)
LVFENQKISEVKKIFKFYIPGVILLTIVILFIQPNPYFRNAIIYTTAGISDHEIFENRTINTGEPQSWKTSLNYNKYILSEEDNSLLKKYESIAFVAIKDTQIVFESYWDGYSQESLSSSFSMAKSFVSLLIGIAINDGLISSVNDPVSKYIPEFNAREYNITIRDLLTMSSGLEWNESYFNPFSVTTKAYYGKNLNKLVLKAKSIQAPAQKFDYITANPQLLSMILKKVTGLSLSEYASEKLWKPLGAESIATWSLDMKGGDEKAFCCFNSNARDFAKLGQLVLNKGSWNGSQVVSESYLNESFAPASHVRDKNNKPVDFYGYQWWICHYNDLMVYYARGILGQYIICIPEKNIVIVRLGHKRNNQKLKHHPLDLYSWIDLGIKICD